MKSYVRIFLFFVACVMASNAMTLQNTDSTEYVTTDSTEYATTDSTENVTTDFTEIVTTDSIEYVTTDTAEIINGDFAENIPYLDTNQLIHFINSYAYFFIQYEELYVKTLELAIREEKQKNSVDCTLIQKIQESASQIHDMLKCKNESVTKIIEPAILYDTIEEKNIVETINHFGAELSNATDMFVFILDHYKLEKETKNRVNCYYLQRLYESASSLRRNTSCHQLSY